MYRLKTHKLFYKKYPFKINIAYAGSANISRLGVLRTQAWIDGNPNDRWAFKGVDKEDVQIFLDSFKEINDSVFTRAEGRNLSIFAEDRTSADKVLKYMQKWVVCITEPASDEEYNFLKENGHKKVLCNNYPKGGKFRYRVYLKPNITQVQREQFYNWTLKYTDKFHISNSTIQFLTNKRFFIQSPFFYVSDQPTLSMVGLFLGDKVQRVEEFIVRASINTECQV